LYQGYKQGDVIVCNGFERKILGVCGEVYFLSKPNNFKLVSFSPNSPKTLHEMNEGGYKLKTEETETEELTMEQVCEELGREVKIKK